MNICLKKAILMKEDECGFLYPQIDEKLCVKCGACKKVCSYQNVAETNNPVDVYAAVSKNTDVLQSTSGGIFASLATSVIHEGGIVYGASMEYIDGVLTPMHIGVDSLTDLIKLQGSKYVQSYIGNTYQEVKKQLVDGRMVLFSGTPCQVAGLKSYLHNDYDTLLLLDLICHGVPSAKFFQDYIAQLENKLKGNIIRFKFRDKTDGWGLNGRADYISKSGNQKSILVLPGESSYYSLFLNSDIYRENCYSCKYANSQRPGDITIGDYWGIEKEHPELLATYFDGRLERKKGVSCLIVNTEKGVRYMELYKSGLVAYPSLFEKVARSNDQLNAPSHTSSMRTYIMDLYKDKGYSAVEKWFIRKQGWKRYAKKLVNMMPAGFKIGLKKMMGKV